MCKILVVVDMQANFIEETGAEHIVPKVACKMSPVQYRTHSQL